MERTDPFVGARVWRASLEGGWVEGIVTGAIRWRPTGELRYHVAFSDGEQDFMPACEVILWSAAGSSGPLPRGRGGFAQKFRPQVGFVGGQTGQVHGDSGCWLRRLGCSALLLLVGSWLALAALAPSSGDVKASSYNGLLTDISVDAGSSENSLHDRHNRNWGLEHFYASSGSIEDPGAKTVTSIELTSRTDSQTISTKDTKKSFIAPFTGRMEWEQEIAKCPEDAKCYDVVRVKTTGLTPQTGNHNRHWQAMCGCCIVIVLLLVLAVLAWWHFVLADACGRRSPVGATTPTRSLPEQTSPERPKPAPPSPQAFEPAPLSPLVASPLPVPPSPEPQLQPLALRQQPCVGGHYMAEAGGGHHVVKVLGPGPNGDIIALPLRSTRMGTLRQGPARKTMQIPTTNLKAGPFGVRFGRILGSPGSSASGPPAEAKVTQAPTPSEAPRFSSGGDLTITRRVSFGGA